MKNEKALVRFGVVSVLLTGLSASACGGPSTTFVSSWRSPKAEPLAMRGEPVVAVVMMQNEITRRSAEDALAREITHYGAKGIPLYTIMTGAPEGNEAAARAAVEAAGVKGAVVMRPKGKRTKTETSEYYSSPMYNGYWGGPMYGGFWGGYYGYGWGQPWSYAAYGLPTSGPMPYYGGVSAGHGTTTTTTTTTEVVVVEVLVYSLKQNKLAWAGESESTPPEKVDEFVAQLAAKTVSELGDKGLLSSK
jgi:hypothetical protein